MYEKKSNQSLADPGGANDRGPMIFYAQNAIFFSIFLRSRVILRNIFYINVAQTAPKHVKNDFYCNTSTFIERVESWSIAVKVIFNVFWCRLGHISLKNIP